MLHMRSRDIHSLRKATQIIMYKTRAEVHLLSIKFYFLQGVCPTLLWQRSYLSSEIMTVYAVYKMLHNCDLLLL